MTDPRLYESDTYVVLETNQPEQFLTTKELLQKLEAALVPLQSDLPRELQRFSTIAAQASYLLETYFELDIGPDQFLQWYVVRLEK